MPESTITITETVEKYLKSLKDKGKKDRTLYTYGQDFKQIQAFFGADKPVSSITLPLTGRFLKSEELLLLPNGKERAPRTVNKTIRVFRMWMVWMQQEGILSELPLPKSIPLGRSQS